MRKPLGFILGIAVGLGLAVGFVLLVAAGSNSSWSPTKPNPTHEVYYPGTEELRPLTKCALSRVCRGSSRLPPAS